MWEDKPFVVEAIHGVVENQLRRGDPPETRQTLDRLVADGLDAEEAHRLIGCVVEREIFGVIGDGGTPNKARFVAALHRLPKLPRNA